MAYNAEVITDSINSRDERLTTFEVTLPRIVLAEFNTHRVLSRNSASSRAIPVEKQVSSVLDDPFIPTYWGINKSGMQAIGELPEEEKDIATEVWLKARDMAVISAVSLIGGIDKLRKPELAERIREIQDNYQMPELVLPTPVHKQISNRLLEPFMWQTIIVTATEWSNFFALRANPQAQPEIQKAAYLMLDAYKNNIPLLLNSNQWHLPLIQKDEMDLPIEDLKKMSVGRCARVSYLTHDTGKRDPEKDISLHNSLMTSGHMSPFEHVARPMDNEEFQINPYSGNFKGWHQYRKDIPFEYDYSLIDK